MKSKQGFTLIEVLLSIVILSILIVPVVNFFVQSIQYSKYNQQKTVATYAARNALVYLENVDFLEYKKFYDDNKSPDNMILEITDPLLQLCESSDVSKLFPLISSDGRKIFDDIEGSKLKCTSIFNPVINEIPYKISFSLKEYEPDYLDPSSPSLTYLKERLISVELKSTWFSEKWESQLMRGFISHEEFKIKNF